MKRLAIIGRTLLALFALGAVMASSASAIEGILPLTKKGFVFEATNPTSENTKGESNLCLKVVSLEGIFENDTHGKAILHFTGCKAAGVFAMNSLGDAKEVILVEVLFLVCLIDSAKLLFGIAFETDKPVHVEVPAAGILAQLEGRFIGHVLTKGNAEKFEVDVTGSKGVGTVKECKDEAGGIKKHTLTEKPDVGAAVEVGLNMNKAYSNLKKNRNLWINDGPHL